jgi:hypothetical protein
MLAKVNKVHNRKIQFIIPSQIRDQPNAPNVCAKLLYYLLVFGSDSGFRSNLLTVKLSLTPSKNGVWLKLYKAAIKKREENLDAFLQSMPLVKVGDSTEKGLAMALLLRAAALQNVRDNRPPAVGRLSTSTVLPECGSLLPDLAPGQLLLPVDPPAQSDAPLNLPLLADTPTLTLPYAMDAPLYISVPNHQVDATPLTGVATSLLLSGSGDLGLTPPPFPFAVVELVQQPHFRDYT